MSNIETKYNFGVVLRQHPQEGNLVWEYNPFHNYRLDQDMYRYQDKWYTREEFELSGQFTEEQKKQGRLYQKGSLVDFTTNELQFDLSSPVNLLPQWSYDNSVNLIINDGENTPKLINSRFSPIGKNKYQICDRKGNNDTNIYDRGDQFEIDTALYKKVNTIPKLKFNGVSYGGNLSVGNYHFYFRYVDEDGNESDFFAESGLVSIFIGNKPNSIYSGFRNENSHKQVQFSLYNTDTGYNKVNIYFTINTSDIQQNAVTQAYKINHSFTLNTESNTVFIITGYEEKTEVPLSDINTQYQIYGSAKTQTAAQNILFLANVDKPKIPYEDLADCALRFKPYLNTDETCKINNLDQNYEGNILDTYYDTKYIYNKVGYWNDEIYRFGIVFIQQDYTLTEVFNVRGNLLTDKPIYSDIDFISEDNSRNYITYNEQNYQISQKNIYENAKGVIKIEKDVPNNKVIGIQFKVPDEVLNYLKNTLKIKGFFFVRQNRIPTTLCQAYTIGIDKESHTPVLPIANKQCITESFLSQIGKDIQNGERPSTKEIIAERILTHNFESRKVLLDNLQYNAQGAICPDYDVNSPYLNSIFNSSELVCRNSEQVILAQQPDNIHFIPNTDEYTINGQYRTVKVLGVEDNVKLVAIGNTMFSARAGEAEEAFRYEYIGQKKIKTEASNLLRGSYGPYLGITGIDTVGTYIDIKIPGYDIAQLINYFQIRANDKSAYFAISERYDINDESLFTKEQDNVKTTIPFYRGDCYICKFTHRVNRNFQDPSSPTNDKIVNPNCWADNYKVEDGVVKKENFDKINLGDVNAVQLGMYVTLTVRSSMNLSIRAIDESMVDEAALFGHNRGFFPLYPMNNGGSYKIPEALCYNKGFSKSLSNQYHYELPDVPWIKNEFSNRISYSNIQVQDAFQNGWRIFLGTNYRDYPKTYGSITKIEEWRGDIICVFEHGIALIPINERALAGSGTGGNIYINTSNVLPENPKILSDTHGSQWVDSIIKTPKAIYGIDTVTKKIWRTDGSSFECISDFRIQEFLNKNITLKEREITPIIGIRNIKTHYNAFKQDVMFTFYDNLEGFEENVWNICFNEVLNKWITFYSWVPSYSENIENQYFSFDRNTSKYISKLGTSINGNSFSDCITLSNVVITPSQQEIGILNCSGYDDSYIITYELIKDNLNNYKQFKIDPETNTLLYIGTEDSIEPVYLLNIKANISKKLDDINTTYPSIETVIAVIKDNRLNSLNTSFWKHGYGGIIDTAEQLKPTFWYGKQHPFEFEFIVNKDAQYHKIFDNLEIVSNSAEPESFHYEIVGDCYSFSFNKQTMYIRQEATKELYQYNGSNLTYNSSYPTLEKGITHELIDNSEYYKKSTILPQYYWRTKPYNLIEDIYYAKDGLNKDFSELAGGEIVYYPNTGEYHIWNHARAIDLNKGGRLRGNMHYKEDKWYVQINPLNVIEKNEPAWDKENLANTTDLNPNKVPIELGSQCKPLDVSNTLSIPKDLKDRAIVIWDNPLNQEVKLKDKYMKIRIRYDGRKRAIINAVNTLFSISYA